ncbi:NBS-LRR resistance protein [Sesbania bispinosa]|nr:NBS-LRR resistance protein [Sesbania bispinosa]
MAESLIGAVSENLLSLVQDEFATISRIKEKVEKLSSTLDMINVVLKMLRRHK